jgi:NADH-quinone oxidoreductase subunit A
MNDDLVQATELWPVIVYFIAILVIVGAMLVVPYFAAQRRLDRSRAEPFESGIVPMGDTHIRLAVHFYPVAIFFVIFDLEAIFIFAWAVSFREVGWLGYIEMLIFIGVLLVALVYLWRVGALDWRTARQKLQDLQLQDERSERCAGH